MKPDVNTANAHEKCAHDSCKCTVSGHGPFGKYCSEHCQDNAELTELRCDCGHPGCS